MGALSSDSRALPLSLLGFLLALVYVLREPVVAQRSNASFRLLFMMLRHAVRVPLRANVYKTYSKTMQNFPFPILSPNSPWLLFMLNPLNGLCVVRVEVQQNFNFHSSLRSQSLALDFPSLKIIHFSFFFFINNILK